MIGDRTSALNEECATAESVSNKRPNIVLVQIGTNQLTHRHKGDAKDSGSISPQAAFQRMSRLLDLIGNDLRGAVILLAMIIPTSCLGRAMDPQMPTGCTQDPRATC